jgi:hypothetical protein
MYDQEVAGALRALRLEVKTANRLKLADWLEDHEFTDEAEKIFRECARDLGVQLNNA